MTLPSHLEVDLAEYDRGGFDDDFERCMEFFAAVLRDGGGPRRLDARINEAVNKGYVSSAGDVLVDGYEGLWEIAADLG